MAEAISRREVLKAGGALAVSPTLLAICGSAAAADKRDPYADAVLVDGEPAALEKGSFTIAVLPDTQHYSERYPDTYLAQTRWIVENQKTRNIASVLHLGDITNNNAPAEWVNAQKAMRELDGRVPYFMVAGNH